MQIIIKKSAAERRRKLANVKAQYAPKVVVPVKSKAKASDANDKQLRLLTAKVLEQLKSPSAIPSNIILAALKAAREVR